MKKLKKRLKNILCHLSVVDRVLVLFLILLFLYTVIHLLFCSSGSEDSNTIDVIVRTSLASIFGYFLSSNLSSPSSVSATGGIQRLPDSSNLSESIRSQIGFRQSSSSDTKKEDSSLLSSDFSGSSFSCRSTRIYLVSAIGIISLLILIVARHSRTVTPELTATVSQLRDFVASCIGFLISCGKHAEN